MSYYSLPSVKCSERKNILSSLYSSNENKCLKVNPTTIYDNLFPGFNDPMSKFSNTSGTPFNNVKTTSDITMEDCASECLLNNDECNNFTYENNTKSCSLLNTTDPSTGSLIDNSITTKIYTKNENSCNDTDPECIGCQSYCASSNSDSYTLTGQNVSILDTDDAISTSAVTSLDKCMDKCNDNTNCKSIFYSDTPSKCKQYKNKTSSGSSIIYEKNSDLGNVIDMKYLPYYNSYKNGIPQNGDYTCGYDSANSSCYQISQKTCPTEDCDIGTTSSEVSGERIYDYPLNGVNTTGRGDGTVGINGFIFDKCISNSGSCVGTVYTNDNTGFPKRDRTPNPPTQDYRVRKTYNRKKNKNFVNCPTGYTVNTDGDKCIKTTGTYKICAPNNVENTDNITKCTYSGDNALIKNRPRLDAFDNVQGCKKWCNENNDCQGISSYIEKGNAKCYYYNNKMFNNLSNFKTSDNHTVYTKREQEKDYAFNIKSHTESLMDNDIPLKASVNQILNPNETNCENNYYNYTSCLDDTDINDDLIKISKQCHDQYGPGYIAGEYAIEGKKSCSSGYSHRYKCELLPGNDGVNSEIINLKPKLNEFFENKNNVSENFQTYTYNAKTMIILIIICLLIYFIIKISIK